MFWEGLQLGGRLMFGLTRGPQVAGSLGVEHEEGVRGAHLGPTLAGRRYEQSQMDTAWTQRQ